MNEMCEQREQKEEKQHRISNGVEAKQLQLTFLLLNK